MITDAGYEKCHCQHNHTVIQIHWLPYTSSKKTMKMEKKAKQCADVHLEMTLMWCIKCAFLMDGKKVKKKTKSKHKKKYFFLLKYVVVESSEPKTWSDTFYHINFYNLLEYINIFSTKCLIFLLGGEGMWIKGGKGDF